MSNILYLNDIQKIYQNDTSVPSHIEIQFQPLQQIYNGNRNTFYVVEIKKSHKSPNAIKNVKRYTKGFQVFDCNTDIISELNCKIEYIKNYFSSAIVIIRAPINEDDYTDTVKIYDYNKNNKKFRKLEGNEFKFIFCKHTTNSYGKKCIANITFAHNPWNVDRYKNMIDEFKMVYDFYKDSDQFVFSSAASQYEKSARHNVPSDFCIFLDDPDDLSFFAFSKYKVSKVFITIDNYDEIEKYV